MPRRQRRERVHGPYFDARYSLPHRAVAVGADAKRRVVGFATKGEAERWIDEARREATDRTVTIAIDAYLDDARARGLRDTTITTIDCRLRTLLQARDRSGGNLAALRPARARRLLDAMGGSVIYRRGALAYAGTWARWVVKQGWLKADPFVGLEVRGRANRGKAQLRIDEARVFATTCRAAAADGDLEALALLLCLLLGCRASEVTDRVARDLDDDGSLLWIPDAKTRAGRRQLEVPDEVRPLLAAVAKAAREDSGPQAPIFGDLNRHHLHHHCGRLCVLAGVTVVCPQSLRGLHATIARERVSTGRLVSEALGHTSQGVTERHYTAPEATARAGQRTALGVIRGGKS